MPSLTLEANASSCGRSNRAPAQSGKSIPPTGNGLPSISVEKPQIDRNRTLTGTAPAIWRNTSGAAIRHPHSQSLFPTLGFQEDFCRSIFPCRACPLPLRFKARLPPTSRTDRRQRRAHCLRFPGALGWSSPLPPPCLHRVFPSLRRQPKPVIVASASQVAWKLLLVFLSNKTRL